MVEQILEDYDRAYGFKSIALRYFNAAGADPDGQLGERHEPETHLIPLVLQAASGRRPQISVYGRDYDTPDGTCIRDYIHVTDLCEAHWLALRTICCAVPIQPPTTLARQWLLGAAGNGSCALRFPAVKSRRLIHPDAKVIRRMLVADSEATRKISSGVSDHADLI